MTKLGTLICVIGIIAIGCGGGGTKAPPKPPEKPEVIGIKKTPTPSCAATAETMATVFFSSLTSPPGDDEMKQMGVMLKTRCHSDRWADNAKECFATMDNTGDVDGCATMLTEPQRTKIAGYELIKVADGKGAATPGGPTTKQPTMAGVLAELKKFRDKMCACKDSACADKVGEEFQKWSRDLDKQFGEDFKPEPKDQEKLMDLVMEYSDCQMKIMASSDDPPPPDEDE